MPEEKRPGLLAARLDELFRTIHPPGRGPYTYREAAETINARAGHQMISGHYLLYLRTGQRTRPAHDKLVAIAEFFGVPVTHFTTPAHDPASHQRLQALAALHDPAIAALARRAAGLSPAALTAVRGILDHTRHLEGLPPHHRHPTRRLNRPTTAPPWRRFPRQIPPVSGHHS